MSSSEENYDLNDISGDDESEGYSPVSKKTVSLPQLGFLSVVIHRLPRSGQGSTTQSPTQT
jgi:hypothetical protein